MLKTLTLINDETISATTSTKVVKMFDRNFAYQIIWSDGSGPDFDIDVEVIFDVCENHFQPLKETIHKMITDLEEEWGLNK